MKKLDPKAALILAAGIILAQVTQSSAGPDSPVLQYYELIPAAPSLDRPGTPNFKMGKLLLTIQSVRSATLEPDGKSILIALNDQDKKSFAELTRKHQGQLLFCQVSAKPVIGGIAFISAPIENGVIEFSEARYSGDIAEYLRHRFWE
jgi:hypothetical protein